MIAQALTEKSLVLLTRGVVIRFVVRNFVCVIDDIRPESSLVETELFPRGALQFYTAKNMYVLCDVDDSRRTDHSAPLPL